MSFQALKISVTKAVVSAVESIFGGDAPIPKIGYPPEVALGDLTVECFILAKFAKMKPNEVAALLAEKIAHNGLISESKVTGPYVNIFLNRQTALREIFSGAYSLLDGGVNGEKVMVEYLSPNTNKPLHLGHMRNGSLGLSISRILAAAGYKVIKANLINDRGVHICKSMIAWQKWGEGKTPASAGIKGDHFVGSLYVRYSQEEDKDPSLKEEIQVMLKKWEDGDPEIIALWKMMNEWVYAGFEESYRNFGLEFDKFYYESETYKLGKDIVNEGLARQIFVPAADGSVCFPLPEAFGLDKNRQTLKATVLRADGTSVYMTQDIGTAQRKVSDYGLDRSIYVVGSEQIHHFKCLFAILKALGYEWAEKCKHLSYGMVYLPDGKMKSREGKVVDADNLMSDLKQLVLQEIQSRGRQLGTEAEESAQKIANAAIKFYLLRVEADKEIHFDPKESISLEGFTGPYCQYAYVRAMGILTNAGDLASDFDNADLSLLTEEEEKNLAKELSRLPEEILSAAENYSPSLVASQVFVLSQAFNSFYNKLKVLNIEDGNLKKARLAMIAAVASGIKKGLWLLGIETVARM
jgi:arginyl-tRNA synthetase